MKLFFISMLLLLSCHALADERKLYKMQYIVEQNDTLPKIFKRFVNLDSVIDKNSQMTQKTFKENPHVEDWRKLEVGTVLNLYIDYEYMNLNKYKAYLQEQKMAFNRVKNFGDENTLSNYLPQGLKASVFYMASQGRFDQKKENVANVVFYQNSPVTLGTSLSFYPKNSFWSFSGSAYASYLIAASNNLDDKDVKVPPEIGATFYNEYRFENLNFTAHFGVDYEQFSTFNMGGIDQDRRVLLDKNTAVYATVGASKLIHILGSPFYTKLSISKSVTSSITPNSEGLKSSGAYDGYKVMWYLNKKITERLYLHSLVKYHSMEGPSQLTTTRIGLGFGYILK